MKIAAIDPSLTNFGLVKLSYGAKNYNSLDIGFSVLEMKLIKTIKGNDKKVRRNSDDLQRAREITDAFQEFIADCDFVFAEIPSGAQNARAAFAFGVVVGILAGCRVPLVQVTFTEAKKASVGTKTASKAEIISWGFEHYPDAPWIKRGDKLTLANEHLADALAIAHAGVKTDQFIQLQALMKRAA